MPLMTGGLAPERCSSAFRQGQVGFSQSQRRAVFNPRPKIPQLRQGRSRFTNQPVLAGPITADKSASQKVSENNTGHKSKVCCHYRFCSPLTDAVTEETVYPQHSNNGSALSTKLVGPPLNERCDML